MQCPVLRFGVVLRAWYAVCGTELGYGATRCAVLRSGMTLPGVPPLVPPPRALSGAACLRKCYAMPGTDVVYGMLCYAIPSTNLVYGMLPAYGCATLYPVLTQCMLPTRVLRDVRYCYAMSGTEFGYWVLQDRCRVAQFSSQLPQVSTAD
eukprot:2656122-Rhodomonas_salina.1